MPWNAISQRLEESRVHRSDIVHHLLAGLREQIFLGKLASGSRLPGEKALAEMLKLSRPTLREALRILAHEGLLVSRWGVGTFITDQLPQIADGRFAALAPVYAPPLWIEPEWTGHDQQRGMVAAPDAVAEALGIEPESPVLRLHRRYFLADRPVASVDEYHGAETPDLTPSSDAQSGRSALLIEVADAEHGRPFFKIQETVFDSSGSVSHVVVMLRSAEYPLRLTAMAPPTAGSL
jgi:GntR family transcriptional regulator